MTKKHRRHSTAKKREVVEAYFQGESMRALSQKHDICRTLIPIWIDKYERGEFDDDAIEEELLPEYETRIAALERLVGPVPFSCRSRCSFKPFSVRRRRGFSSPMLSVGDVDCRSR